MITEVSVGYRGSLSITERLLEPLPSLNRISQDREDALAEIERLTRERDALREALTPSGATESAYIGEFRMDFQEIDEFGNERTVRFDVPWTTVKEIMAAILKRASLNDCQ